MARGAVVTVENNFTRGLITEFTAMNFPENAVTESDNCVFSELGSVTRRLGIDYEISAVQQDYEVISPNPGAVVEYRWYSVGNNGTITFVVQQLGDTLSFFENSTGNSISAGLKSFTVELSDFMVSGTTQDKLSGSLCQFTSGRGFLFVVHPYCEPFYVRYDPDLDDIVTSEITVEIRDLQGLEETSLEVDERPTSLSNLHKYNLYNQGWYFVGDSGNVLDYFYTQVSSYPSDADIWWLFKDASENFVPTLSNDKTLGNTPAPKGHYIYNAFDINRTTKTGIASVETTTSEGARPSVVCFYAGRLFYAGVNKDGFADQIYFSQIIERDDQFGKCYQINDPTSETIFDLLDTDGGTISLPLIERVIALKVINDSLVVLGSNSIFVVRGTENGPFRATNYAIEYISSIGAISSLSVIEVDGGLMWFNNDGIYAIGRDQIGVSFQAQSISKTTIQDFVDDIPVENRVYIKGAYNKKDQIARWIFSDEDSAGYTYNRILELNTISKAFYPYTIDTTTGPVVVGILTTSGQSVTSTTDSVVAAADPVTTTLADTVVVTTLEFIPNSETFKFPTINDDEFSYSEFNNGNYLDWDAESYESTCLSGYRIRGELLRKFNSTPVAFVLRQIPGSKVLVGAVWDYGQKEYSQQAYRENPYVQYVVRRLKFRGRGKSLQIRLTSVDDSPFDVVGWSTFDTGGTTP